jgi:hypothetical protein
MSTGADVPGGERCTEPMAVRAASINHLPSFVLTILSA